MAEAKVYIYLMDDFYKGFPGVREVSSCKQVVVTPAVVYFHKGTMLKSVGLSFLVLLSAVGAATMER